MIEFRPADIARRAFSIAPSGSEAPPFDPGFPAVALQASPATILDTTLIYTRRPAGCAVGSGITDPRSVRVADARGQEGHFTLDRQGFAVLRAPTRHRALRDAEALQCRYLPEAEALLRWQLGAGRVVGLSVGMRIPCAQVQVAPTALSVGPQLRRLMPAEQASHLLAHRWVTVSLWRPLNESSPALALCDGRSVAGSDLLSLPVHGITASLWNPAHRWVTFPELETEEVLVVKGHDSLSDGRARLALQAALPAARASGPGVMVTAVASWAPPRGEASPA